MDNIIPSFLVVSRYNENIDWVDQYTNNYLIYNKGGFIREDKRIIAVKNIGNNQRDIFNYIVENYEKLPTLVAFCQGNPFDHCPIDKFNEYIIKEKYTPLEFHGYKPNNSFENRTDDGFFLEINQPWYIVSHNQTYNQSCKYSSLDEFMNKYFFDYKHLEWIQFAPGSQYLVEKEQLLYYSKSFWNSLMNELPENNMTVGHIIERCLHMIFLNKYIPKSL